MDGIDNPDSDGRRQRLTALFRVERWRLTAPAGESSIVSRNRTFNL
jgi:hypothetical protein